MTSSRKHYRPARDGGLTDLRLLDAATALLIIWLGVPGVAWLLVETWNRKGDMGVMIVAMAAAQAAILMAAWVQHRRMNGRR